MQNTGTAEEVKLCDCGHPPSKHESITTGYGLDDDGKTYCYDCCAKRDKEQMLRDGKAALYLTYESGANMSSGKLAFGSYFDGKVSNWPGSLSFKCRVRLGSHNIARTRYDVWFIGPDRKEWHGVQYGENTQICRCKRGEGKRDENR